MLDNLSASRFRRSIHAARVLGSLTALIGLTVICGWIWDIRVLKSLDANLVPMKANTAGMFCICGIALAANTVRRRHAFVRWVIKLSCAAVSLFALAILSQYIFSIDLGINEFFYPEDSTLTVPMLTIRMSPLTAISFVLVGIALFADRHPYLNRIRTSLSVTVLAISIFNFSGYMYGVREFYQLAAFTSMALPTTIGFILLSLGMLLAHPEHGMMRLANSDSSAGTMLRHLMPAAILLPLIIGWLIIEGLHRHWYSAEFGTAMFVLITVVIFTWLIFGNALLVAKKAAEASEAEAASTAKSSSLANMSHEIRTPLTAVLGFSELLTAPRLSPEEIATFADTIKRNGELLSNIISDILDISKVEAGKLEIEMRTISLHELLADVLTLLQAKAREKNIELTISHDGNVPTEIETDPLRLKQILLNIVGNAVKFTDQGQVEVVVRFAAVRGKNQLSFIVRDTGPGISETHISSLFIPFSQGDASTARRFGGTGLGLVLSRRLAVLLGGTVVLTETQPGRGSTFTITINPGSGVALPAPNQEKLVPAESIDLNGVNVLVAEDAPDIQSLIEHFLQNAGAYTETANDGRQAIDRIKAKNFDVILMDVQMPVMDGFAALDELRRKGCNLPIIAVSAFAMKSDRQRYLEHGFNDHLSKPIDQMQLVEKVSHYARNH